MKHCFYFLFIFLQTLSAEYCFSQKLIFDKVLPPGGKTFEHVTAIVQDQQGYMWFASKKGLYKYDGYHMISYKNNTLNTNSLASNNLESICADSNGIIWIGTLGAGLDRLDPSTGNFTHFYHTEKNISGLSNDTVASLLCDHEGTLWLGTHGGLDRFDPKTNTFIHYRYHSNDPASISNNQVRSIYEDKENTIWIGTGSPFPDNGGTPEDGGLNRFNKKTGKFIRYLHDPDNPNSLINNKVRSILEDSKGNFWIGTAGDGLHIMDRSKGTFKRYTYDPLHPEKLSRPPVSKKGENYSHITFISEDAAGAIWIGTLDEGINYYDTKTGKVKLYKSEVDSAGQFSGNSSWAAYTSRDGIFWISTLNGNLYKIDPLQKLLPHYQLPTPGPVNSFYQQVDGILLLGSTSGLLRLDTNKTIKLFTNDQHKPSTISNNMIMSIKADRQNRIWVGTQSGLNLFDKNKESFTRYFPDQKNKTAVNDFIVSVFEDQQRNLWLGTYYGLYLMDQKTSTFKNYFFKRNDSSVFGPNLITSIVQDKDGKLWIGAWGRNGVNQFNRQTGKFENYLRSVNISCMLEDADGELWAGGDDGLYKYNRSSKIFTSFIDPSSLTGIPEVISITEDNKKNLWLGTINGIIELNAERNETTKYGENYGVKENTLVYTSAYKGQDGKLFFGDTTGYYAFFPDQLTKNSRSPEILLTGFSIANRIIQPGSSNAFEGLLWKTGKISLHYNQNIFSFDFVSIDYTDPEANRSLYMLENYDNEWRIADRSGRAYYFNVPPGKYIFKIKSSNSYGVWSQKEIAVTITPPWWNTWWAYMLYFICFFSLSFFANRIVRKRILEKERMKNKEKELAQAKEIEKAYHELKSTQAQLIQSEKMASLGELTAGIAHEIQNPLNFVNNFSEVNRELIEELKTELTTGNQQQAMEIAEDIKDNEEKIIHHGRRADAIVKGMLQHSRTSAGQKELTDINALADEYLRLSYHGLRAKEKSFNATMQTDFDESIGKINIIPQDIGRVLLNLYNNAFYALIEKKKNPQPLKGGEEYEPTVFVSTKAFKSPTAGGDLGVIISVKDNGNGIPQKVVDKIFQPFFTTKPTGQGTGLGLSLSYDIIKAHGGEIKVETKEGNGTEFIIQLPTVLSRI